MKKFHIAALALVATAFALPAMSADMIQTYQPQRERYVVEKPRPVRAYYAETKLNSECGDVIVEYRSVPQYTEIVTLCNRPAISRTHMQ